MTTDWKGYIPRPDPAEKPEAPVVRRVKLFNFNKPRRVFGKLESEQNRLHGALIKPDGDAA